MLPRCCAVFASLLPLVLGWPAQAGGGLKLSSPAFEPGQAIPRQYTCQGADRSPALAWSGVPAGARSLVLIVEDPDAPDPKKPKMVWKHWLLYDLPAASEGLPAGVAPGDLPAGTRQGTNSWKKTGWGGPCPPTGRHRYFFRLYALDAELGELDQPTAKQLRAAMEGHVLARAELMGSYAKSKQKTKKSGE